VWAL